MERAFIDFLDKDGEVERFLKISENMHPFAVIYYMRKDGLMATYHPDFIVATSQKVYLIETKGNDKLFDKNVRQKQTAAVEWTRKINEIKAEERMNREWEYVLISEDNFYGLSHNGATITDICDRCKVSLSAAMGELFVLNCSLKAGSPSFVVRRPLFTSIAIICFPLTTIKSTSIELFRQ